jgi:tetratricopeptide (TPR) repeat protein
MFASSMSGESPPPPPRACFGRDELIEKIAGFTELRTPIALIGVGGIGKTAAVLTILHHDRIKQQFGEDRRFIRCDQFPPSRAHFLRRLSKVVGAGIENPEDLASLRPFLSSKKMLVVLDNAESVLDLQGTNRGEIYSIVDELSQFNNICLCITSRISTIPPDFETFEIPTLSMDAAYDTFYRIYRHSERSGPINNILEQLDFHPLSLTLLATVAQHNKWGADRLVIEWEKQRTGVLHAQHSRSLAATIELSLASPMFRELGPGARELLGAVAFFPQGVNEKNIDLLFPTISNGPNMLDKFCILSLAYRSDGFITMLAPLRDYLRPQDPTSSPLLNTTRDRYFTKLSVDIYPGKPGFEESRWITSEDVNTEHLLDVFASIDGGSQHVWDACFGFLEHLRWHKPRLVMLGPKIEGLPDDHPSKPQCLHNLSWLFDSVGNLVERKQLLTHALRLWRERGDDHRAAQALCDLSDTNRLMNLSEEGIQQAREASETFERLGDTVKHAASLVDLAWLLCTDNQADAAEEAASRAIDLLPEKGEQLQLCWGHRVLGIIYASKRETEKAIHHFEVALRIGSSLNLASQLFWVHYALAQLFSREERFDDARAHVEHAKSHAANTYFLARVSLLRAEVGEDQHTFEEARSEALHALDAFEKLGAGEDAEFTRELLRRIGDDNPVTSGADESGDDGEFLVTASFVAKY